LRIVEALCRNCIVSRTRRFETSAPAYRGFMPRPLRIQAAGAIYHIAARGNSGRPIFLDDRDRKLFLTLFGMTVARYGWHCYGFCLMTTHYHLLVMTPEANLARGMQFLNGLYAQRFNKRHANEGHVFRGRYQSTLVEGNGHFVELCRYLPRNPIRAGMCKAAAEWPWSSYRATVGVDKAPTFLTVEPILELFSTSVETARKRFAAFVDGA
jgi:putative transposase